MSKAKQLDELRETLESGIITQEEYETRKKEIEEEPEIEERPEEENIENPEEKMEGENKKGDKILIALILGLVLIFIIFFSLRVFTKQQPTTIEEMHILNLKGKLKPDQGYVYNDAYSFIKFDDFWYMQLQSPKGTMLYNMALRYGPRDLEDIRIIGKLNTELFNNATNYYVTFNPLGNEFTHVRLARFDYDTQMIKVFQKMPISACDRNVTNITTVCAEVPIITCENTDDIVVYFNESDRLSVEYKDNCIMINGNGFELVKGVDRVLLNLYGIMEQ